MPTSSEANLPTCIANEWAVRPDRSGIERSLRFKVAGDGSSVVILVQRQEDGKLMRMNFSRAAARALQGELWSACMLKDTYDPHGVLDRRAVR